MNPQEQATNGLQNTNEARKALGVFIQEGANVAADGKLAFDDIDEVFRAVTAAAPAVQDAKEIFPELASASNEEMDLSDAIIGGELRGFSAETTRDLIKVENGVVAVLRLIARARAEGRLEGRQELALQIKSGEVLPEEL